MPIQAKDIPNGTMLAVLSDRWQSTGALAAEHFPEVPAKVVHAKLRHLLKQRLIHGCPCGCRGDWHLAAAHCPCGNPARPAAPEEAPDA